MFSFVCQNGPQGVTFPYPLMSFLFSSGYHLIDSSKICGIKQNYKISKYYKRRYIFVTSNENNINFTILNILPMRGMDHRILE